jgi:N-acetylglucosamine kinase-like BadF-type ATPase
MRKIVAVDAGGTSSRAVVLDPSGDCRGFGRAGAGNPTAVGIDAAVEALGLAVARALGADRGDPDADSLVVIALAGAETPVFVDRLGSRFAALGLGGAVAIEPDLLGTFCSGTALEHGYAVIAGTGAIAARVSEGRIHTVRGGSGWLLGDTGSGFWIGHRVARAVVAALDGIGRETALTGLLLEATGIERTVRRIRGRVEELTRLERELYALQPVELARFAPLAFEAADDPVAREILDDAAEGIARILAAAVETDVSGAVVLGGSVLAAGMQRAPAIFTHRLRAAAGDAQLIPVADGVVGAAVLALRRLGIPVDAKFHRHLTGEIDRARGAAAMQ